MKHMDRRLEPYRALVPFLGQALGPDYEVALHDLTGETGAVAALSNGGVTGQSLGAPLCGMARRFVQDGLWRTREFVTGYQAESAAKGRLRASALFIRDGEALIGMLCIYFDAAKYSRMARELLAQEQPDFKQNKKQILEEIQADGRELLAKMGLSERANHYPSQLSGGQQQRVALARAVVIEPSVLLFDEPLSNLDAKLRESMRDELRALQKRLGITSLYVTHDQSEAMAISDRVVIMKDGVICQQGTPTEIYEQPNSRFVANFIGKANFIDGTFRGMDGENALVEVGGHTFPIPAPGKMEGVQKDGPCCLAVRPESILLSEEEGPLSGRVSRATYYGAKVEYEVMLGDQPIIVEVYNPQLSKRFAEGEAVHMTLIDRCVRVLA